jgi:hypothetical protein
MSHPKHRHHHHEKSDRELLIEIACLLRALVALLAPDVPAPGSIEIRLVSGDPVMDNLANTPTASLVYGATELDTSGNPTGRPLQNVRWSCDDGDVVLTPSADGQAVSCTNRGTSTPGNAVLTCNAQNAAGQDYTPATVTFSVGGATGGGTAPGSIGLQLISQTP